MKTTAIILFSVIACCGTARTDDGSPWKRHTIDPSDPETGKKGADGVRLEDINGDNFPDVVTGWENGDAIRVCLNPGPEKAKLPWPGVTVGRVAGAEDAVFADLDGDGAFDIVSSTEGKTRTLFVHWSPQKKEKILDPTAWKTESVPASKSKQMWMFALPFDVNRDGAIDLIVGSKGGGASISWLKNPGKSVVSRFYPNGNSFQSVRLDGL